MTRPNGHIRQRGDSWEIRYSFGKNVETGKRRIATATIRGSRKDAEKELRRLLRTLDTGEHVDPTRTTVEEWLTGWLSEIREEISPKSHERYSEIVSNYLIPSFGSLPMAKLVPLHIRGAYAKWASSGRKDGKAGGLSPATRRYIHRILRASLSRAVDDEIISRNPADVFRKRLPKVEKKVFDTLDADQSAQLLVAISGTRVYWPVLMALATGARRGEILALRWRNVDLERGRVSILESLEQTKSGGLRFKAPKSEKARAISLPAFMIDRLRLLRRLQAEELLALGVRQTGATLVCCKPDGEPEGPRGLSQRFKREMDKTTGIPKVRFHDLRHSHATQLLLAGIHPKVAQERLGHSTIATTMNLYSHVTEPMQEKAAACLDEELGGAISSLNSKK